MVKKFAAFAAGAAMLTMATIVPVMAQATSDTEVEVQQFINFSISNASGDCATTKGGQCPFGTNQGGSETQLTADTGSYAYGYSTGNTEMTVETNETTGWTVSTYVSTGGATDALVCEAGGPSGCTAGTTVITDTIDALAAAQAANDIDIPHSTTPDTGLGFRVLDATTSAAARGADEDTQWGASDVDATARWASFPIGSGAAAAISDNTVAAPAPLTIAVKYFVGINDSQEPGAYTSTITYTATAGGN